MSAAEQLFDTVHTELDRIRSQLVDGGIHKLPTDDLLTAYAVNKELCEFLHDVAIQGDKLGKSAIAVAQAIQDEINRRETEGAKQ
ncbi:hypothetical protein U8335_02280 [Roseiconus lacunae]|uniref:hypothetical protein n=1 Tax=Roseiconus lacunae TaxID=2605694 RepID=UPI003087B89E|nr:hypothetical protein U8335_02280 [Stieleria sp. HD01]